MTDQSPDRDPAGARPSAARIAAYLVFLVGYYAAYALVFTRKVGEYVQDLERHFPFFRRPW
jgi:hypothetical protein